MKSRYLCSMSSKMCFLSRLMGSGTKSGLFRSASNLKNKSATELLLPSSPGERHIFELDSHTFVQERWRKVNVSRLALKKSRISHKHTLRRDHI